MSKTLRKNHKKGIIYKDKDRKSQKVSRHCLHHGGCPYCEGNRLHSFRKKKYFTELEIWEEINGSNKLL